MDVWIQMLNGTMCILYEIVFGIENENRLKRRKEYSIILDLYYSTRICLWLCPEALLRPLYFNLSPLFLSLIAYHGGLDSDGNQANSF